jgi:hypothetical protein
VGPRRRPHVDDPSDVRIDYVHHALSAALGLRGVLGEEEG